jgi:hypothetical protein
MMRRIALLFPLLFSFITLNGQTDLNGVWQGVMIKTGGKIDEGTILFTSFSINEKNLDGQTRDEIHNTEYFAVKKIRGSVKGNTIRFSQIALEKRQKRTGATSMHSLRTMILPDSLKALTQALNARILQAGSFFSRRILYSLQLKNRRCHTPGSNDSRTI